MARPKLIVWVLGAVWIAMVALHLIYGLGDLRLWIGFPLLFLPWVLMGSGNWFDR